eukprot:1161865-Pelagomonas_calceolata.AAC.15
MTHLDCLCSGGCRNETAFVMMLMHCCVLALIEYPMFGGDAISLLLSRVVQFKLHGYSTCKFKDTNTAFCLVAKECMLAAPCVGDVINHGKHVFWGKNGMHYHQDLGAVLMWVLQKGCVGDMIECGSPEGFKGSKRARTPIQVFLQWRDRGKRIGIAIAGTLVGCHLCHLLALLSHLGVRDLAVKSRPLPKLIQTLVSQGPMRFFCVQSVDLSNQQTLTFFVMPTNLGPFCAYFHAGDEGWRKYVECLVRQGGNEGHSSKWRKQDGDDRHCSKQSFSSPPCDIPPSMASPYFQHLLVSAFQLFSTNRSWMVMRGITANIASAHTHVMYDPKFMKTPSVQHLSQVC